MNSKNKLGRYKILEKIGSGGMGEVYLAEDVQLNRKVALKVLLPEFCSDLERVKRFKFEAKAVSALNHHGIITIHEIAEVKKKVFITTEFIDGVTLRKRIEAKDLTVYDAVKIAEQIADALIVAHEANIIHRDIKPENIMIRNDGYVKILDFGLAKPILPNIVQAEAATVQMVKTQPGLVMGSVRYMSPEQARGKETDVRTDIWSLGVVLNEMLTGKNPFDGETISDSLAAIIHENPELSEDIPADLRWIINKALNKNLDERYVSIRDFALDLKDVRHNFEHLTLEHNKLHISQTEMLLKQDTSENKTLIHQTVSNENEINSGFSKSQKTGFHSISVPLNKAYVSTALITLITFIGLGGLYLFPAIFGKIGRDFSSIQVSRLTDNGDSHLAAVSPDGKLTAFVEAENGKSKLLVRQIANGGTVELVPSKNKQFKQPTFSSDGEYIFYVEVENGVGTLFRIATLGGKSKKLVYDIDSRVSVSPDGKQLAFVRHNPSEGGDTIFLIDEKGENLTPFIKTKDVGFNQFSEVIWSNDGGKLYAGGYENSKAANRKVKFISVRTADKKIENPDEFNVLNKDGWIAAQNFTLLDDNSGYIFIGKKNTDDNMQIRHLPFESGDIKQITTDTSDYDSVSVSSDGKTIVATKVDKISNLLSYNPKTKETKQIIGDSRNLIGYRKVSQMNDGKILFTKRTGNEINIFSITEEGNDEKQLTSENKFNLNPNSTTDGKYIVFSSNRDGSFGIWRMNTDGNNSVRLTDPQNAMDGGIQLANDNKTVIFARQREDGGRSQLMKVPIDGGRAELLMPDSQTSDIAPSISADRTKIAYLSLFYDSKTSEFNSNINTFDLRGDKISENSKKIEFNLDPNFAWSSDNKSLTYIKRSGNDNLWNISLENNKETQLTEFNKYNLLSFLWSNKGDKIFIVRGVVNSDLILIKENLES